jgi:hypothetical protein
MMGRGFVHGTLVGQAKADREIPDKVTQVRRSPWLWAYPRSWHRPDTLPAAADGHDAAGPGFKARWAAVGEMRLGTRGPVP